MSDYLLKRRSIMLGQRDPDEKKKPKPLKKQTNPIPKQSKKRQKEQPKYVKLVKDQVEKDNRCKIGSPVCTGIMQGFNHRQKSSPSNRMNKSNLVPSCNACNNFLESHSKWALENGHTVSRFVILAEHDKELNTTIITPIS